MPEIKVHFHNSHNYRILFCSGRHVEYASLTDRIADVTCGSCKKRIAKVAQFAYEETELENEAKHARRESRSS